LEAAQLMDTFFETSRACRAGASNHAKNKTWPKDSKMKNAYNVATRQSDIQTETAKQRNACFICNDVSHLKAECPMRSKAQNKTISRKSKSQPGFVK